MLNPRRILVAFDGSGSSKRACDHALELACAFGARLTLVHVLEPFGISLTAGQHAALVTATMGELERTAQPLRALVGDVESRVMEGTAAEGIVTAARDCGADFVVMGCHGHRGFAHAALGSVAARVVRLSSVPVVTVPAHVAASRSVAAERLASALAALPAPALAAPNVVALSRGALPIASAIADRFGGTLDLWGVERVVTPDGLVLGAVGEDGAVRLAPTPHVPPQEREEAVASARTRLARELTALKGARSIGSCWRLDVVIVADGLFDAASTELAIHALREVGPKRIILATPIGARAVLAQLEPEVDALVALQRATLAETCTYREGALPGDREAEALLLEVRAPEPVLARTLLAAEQPRHPESAS
jgi:nucleotide-binding universal stress UspA family protein/predicted phosphoribosyltransferase